MNTTNRDAAAKFDAEMSAKYGSKSLARDNMTEEELDARQALYKLAITEEAEGHVAQQNAIANKILSGI